MDICNIYVKHYGQYLIQETIISFIINGRMFNIIRFLSIPDKLLDIPTNVPKRGLLTQVTMVIFR
ncbi:MAG: hypothetical protein CM15mV45_370 [uncultured marine virus]|nr:MAG: hypothetical protein CM15mV45_370 [uncultured marine virus]